MSVWHQAWMGMLAVGLAAAFAGCGKKSDKDQIWYDMPATQPVPEVIHVAVVFKQKETSIARERFRRGAEAAAKEIGNMTVTFHEPAVATVAAQIKIMEELRVQAAHVQIVEAADPYASAPEMRKIRQQEFQLVTLESDCDQDKSHRLFFLSPYPTAATAKLLAQLSAREGGGSGEIGVVGGSRFSIPCKRLQEKIQQTMSSDYPKVTLVDPVFTDDQEEKAQAETKKLLAEHPRLKSILVLSRTILPAVARAVEEAKVPVAVIGLGTPMAAREFIQRGTVRYLLTWNPEDFGYFTATIGRKLVNREVSVNQRHHVGRLGLCVMDDDEMPLAEPIVVTADTISAYDY